jgi:uncharacterized protein YkwD
VVKEPVKPAKTAHLQSKEERFKVMKNIRKLTAAIILLAAILASFPVSASAESTAPYKDTEDEILRLYNKARAGAGMTALEQDSVLTELARVKAAEMAEKRLDAPEFPDGIKKYLKNNSAEATAHTYCSAVGKKKPAEVVEVWKTHINFDRDTWAKEKTTHIGVGAAKAADGKMYYVFIATKPFGEDEKTALIDEVIRLVNAERKKAGLTALAKNDDLMKVAGMKSDDMSEHGYCAHESPTYGSPKAMVNKYAKSLSYSGEIIAAGQQTAKDVFTAWRDSSAHYAIMLKKTADSVGIGVSIDSKGNYIWSMFLARK